MVVVNRCLFLVAMAVALAPPQNAQAQAGRLQGAWIEEGSACDSAFEATQKGVAFKRPASAFAPAFIVSGNRLSTPLAVCRLIGISPNGPRQVVRLNCTTSVATDSARAVFAPADDGGIYRYHSVEGGIATKYLRCSRDALKAP